MSRLIEFYRKYLARLNKYWVVTVLFLVFTFVIGDSNLYYRYVYDEKINSLEEDIRYYKKEIEISKQKIEDLKNSRTGLEQFAREEYLMKKADEDIFIIDE